jgi:hypothetical protein
MDSLYETWLNRIDSYYEDKFFESVIELLCQYRGGSVDGRIGKGKIFNAGYEVFIYAFFLGLYYGERRPLVGDKRKFRMEMSSWGRKKNEDGRKSYPILQKYIFTALVAKSSIDLLALDKGELDVNDACGILMTTLNEYANSGFYLMKDQIDRNPELFFENRGLLDFLKNFCPNTPCS